MSLNIKEKKLIKSLQQMGSVIVALSGGLDSSYLTYIAYKALKDKAIAITGVSPSLSKKDLQDAKEIARWVGIKHLLISTNEFKENGYIKNDGLRCYFCKRELFKKINAIAQQEKINYIIDGSNCDDLNDNRPGRRAAEEYGIRSPFIEAGLSKDEIRRLAKKHKIPISNKAASPCLSSRIPINSKITIKKLKQIEEGESFLASMGFKIFRLRHHNSIARLEFAPEEFLLLLNKENRINIIKKLKSLGFKYVVLDLEGYRLSGRTF